MVTEIKTEAVDPRVVRLEANSGEVKEVWLFDNAGNCIGSEYRLISPPEAT